MFLANDSPAVAQSRPLNSLVRAADMYMIIYPKFGMKPLAIVRAGQIYVDYERRGFFRIGLLPIPVAENVQIQIQSADCLTNALLALGSWDQSSVGVKRLELRNLEIRLFGEEHPRLSAANARAGPDGSLELTKVSLFTATGQPTSIPKATLQVGGSSVGWLHWNIDGQPQDAFLFSSTSNKTP